MRTKTLLRRLSAAMFTLALVVMPAVHAQDWALGYGIGSATADTTSVFGRGVNNNVIGNNLSNASWFATSAKPSGVPRVSFLDVSTDMPTLGIDIYVATNSVTLVSNTPTAGTNVFNISNTNGLGSGDILLLQNLSGSIDSYQLIVNSNNSALTLVTFTTVSNACVAGDKLYKLARVGNIKLMGSAGQTAQTNIAFANLISGREGTPLVLVARGSNAVTLNSVSGEFFRRPRF